VAHPDSGIEELKNGVIGKVYMAKPGMPIPEDLSE